MEVKKLRKKQAFWGRIAVGVLAFLGAASLLCISAVGAESYQAKNAAYAKEMYGYLDDLCTQHYFEKVEGDPYLAEALTCGVIQEYVSEIKARMLSSDASSRSLEGEFDLLCEKGKAAGILSWIYYSNYDVRDIESVRQIYISRLSVIKSATDVYFFKSGEVEGCYTLLLQGVYSEKIRALALDGDSSTVSAMISAAPASMGALCRYDVARGGEDGNGYREFYENTLKSVTAQRNRDAASYQVEYAFLQIFKGEGERIPSELADFYNSLNTKTSRAEMNALAADTVGAFLAEAKEGRGEYAALLIDGVSLNVLSEAERASGVGEAVNFERLFGDFSLRLLRADCKDSLKGLGDETVSKKNCSEALAAVLYSGLDEYLKDGGLFDLADEAAASVILARGRLECEWFSFFADRLYEIEGFLGAECGISVSARAKYFAVAEAIRSGNRLEADLAEDRAQLCGLVTQAEALRFESDHYGILNDGEIRADDLEKLEAAVLASEKLSPEAAIMLSDRLNYLLECIRAAAIDEVLSGGADDALKEKRLAAAGELVTALRGLEAEITDGIIDLSGFFSSAKEYIGRGEVICGIFDAYLTEYGETGRYFSEEAQGALSEAVDTVIAGEYGGDTVGAWELFFAKLYALEGIFFEAEGYFEGAAVGEILTSAEEQIRALTDKGEIVSLASEMVGKIRAAVWGIEVDLARDEISLRGNALLEKIEKYEYISDSVRNSLKGGLTLLLAQANEKVADAADADGVTDILSAAISDIEAFANECDGAELSACREYAEAAFVACVGEKDDYSEANYALITELLREYGGLLDEKVTVEEIKALTKTATERLSSVEDRLREAKRIYLASLLAARDALLEVRERYSPENAARIEEIYLRTVAEISAFTEISSYTEIAPLCILREGLMREVPVNKVYTADGAYIGGSASYPQGYDAEREGYFGAVFAEGGLPSEAYLTIKNISSEGIENMIKRAARKKWVYLLGGEAAKKDTVKALKSCRVIAAVDIDLGVTRPESGSCRVTVLIPESVDTADALGVVFVGEDGRVEFYPLTMASGTAEFETGHFSKYYIVGRGETDLTPIIACLSIVVVCELLLVGALLLLRRRRRKEEALFLITPVLLAQRYRPIGGAVAVGVLSAVALALGGVIVYLLALEIKEMRRRRERSALKRSDGERAEDDELEVAHALALSQSLTLAEEYAEEIHPEDENHGDADAAAEFSEAEGEDSDGGEAIALGGILKSVSAEEADSLMSDAEAMMQRTELPMSGARPSGKRAEVNLDAVSAVFSDGDTVSVDTLREKGLIGSKAKRVKVLGRGILDKRLTVIAEDFSASAEKMILLVGGTVIYKR